MTPIDAARAADRREHDADEHADWLARWHAPAWLELAGLPGEAARLRKSTDPTVDLRAVLDDVHEHRFIEQNLARRWVLWRASIACSEALAALQRASTERLAAASDRIDAARRWAAEQTARIR